MVEAVALFDYNGRTNKELSFKKDQTIYIYKKMNHEWWLGHLAGGSQSGYIPDGYIKLKSRFVIIITHLFFSYGFFYRRRDSIITQNTPQFSLTSNVSTPITVPSLSNDRSHASISTASTSQPHRHSFDFSLVDEHNLQLAKETEIIEAEYDINNQEEDDDDDEEDNSPPIENHSNPPIPASRTVYDVLSPTNPPPSIPVSSSPLTSIHDQQIIDIDTALREIISGIQTVEESHAQYFRSVPTSNASKDVDAPDLVINLPKSNGFLPSQTSKSFDENLLSKPSLPPVAHSTTIIDLTPSRSNSSSPELTLSDKIPPSIMKKPEKTLYLLERLGLNQTNESLCTAKKSSLMTHFNINHREHQSISISASSKATQV